MAAVPFSEEEESAHVSLGEEDDEEMPEDFDAEDLEGRRRISDPKIVKIWKES